MSKLLARILLAAVLIGPATSLAAPASRPVHADEILACNQADPAGMDARWRSVSAIAPNSQLLPQERWTDSASRFHTRLDADAWNDLPEKVTRNILVNQALAFGNAAYSIGTGLVQFAADFDVLCSGAPQADQAASMLGRTVLSSSVLVLVFVAGVVLLVWRAAQGSEKPWKKAGRMALTLGILGGMTFAAGQSTPSVSGAGSLGRGSPGWFMDRANALITSAGSLGPGALQSSIDASGAEIDAAASQSVVAPDCTVYIDSLRQQYASSASSRTPLVRYKASVALTMSSMWEQSGMRVWEIAQFGYTDAGRRVGCRLLEDFAGTPSNEQRERTIANCAGACAGDPSVATFEMDSNKAQDWALIAWASCRSTGGGWAITDEFRSVFEDEAAAIEACATAWSSGERQPDNGTPSFNFENETEIREATAEAPAARQFLLNFQGHASSAALAASIGFVISSVLVMLCFGALAFAVIVGKMLVVAMIPMLIIALAMSLWPGRADDAKVAKIGKYAFGAMVFSMMYYFLLALVALLSGIIATAGASALGEGSLLGSLWIGLAPVISIVVLNMMIKGAGMPSPFKPTAALGYAAALAGTGAAVGVGIDRALSGLRRSAERSMHYRRRDKQNARRFDAATSRGNGSVSSHDRPTGSGGMGASPTSSRRHDAADGTARTQSPDRRPRTGDVPAAESATPESGNEPTTPIPLAGPNASDPEPAPETASTPRPPVVDYGRRRGLFESKIESGLEAAAKKLYLGAPGRAAREARQVAATLRGSDRRVVSSRPVVAAAAAATAAGTLAGYSARKAAARTRQAADVKDPRKAARVVRTGVKAAAFGATMAATGGLAIPAAAAAWGAGKASRKVIDRGVPRVVAARAEHERNERARVESVADRHRSSLPTPQAPATEVPHGSTSLLQPGQSSMEGAVEGSGPDTIMPMTPEPPDASHAG